MNREPRTIAVVAGGTPPIKAVKADCYIGVDRGVLWLLQQGIAPDIAVGDFDSVTKKEKKYIHDHSKTYIEYPPQKDATDLELAVEEAIRLRPKEVRIYGALGKRFDHSMVAVGMLLRLESHNIYGEIVDNFSKVHIVRTRETLQKDKHYPFVSILPVGSSAIVTLKGFAYNVTKKTISAHSSLGISNEIIGKSATIIVHGGQVLIVQSRDS